MMNKYLEQLVALSRIDTDIDGFEPKIQAISKPLKDAKRRIERLQAQIENYDAEIKELKTQQVGANAHISEFSEKISDIAKKVAAVKTEKEANALKLEEDIAREQLDSANEEINRLDRILASKEDFKKESAEQKSKEESALEALSTEINAQVAVLEKERGAVDERKNKLCEQMNQKILSFYQKIRKWAKNTAVVPVRKQACYGCFMKIYDKTYLAILKGEEIVTCPHCGRILFKEPESAEQKAANEAQKPAKKAASGEKVALKSAQKAIVAEKTAAKAESKAILDEKATQNVAENASVAENSAQNQGAQEL